MAKCASIPTGQRSAAALNADAFTFGSDIFFAANRWNPHTASGRQLIAHELTHTVQQSRNGRAIQRFVPCTHANLSLEECPKREPGEESRSRLDPMIVEYITAPEVGFLIANFGIAQSSLKPGAQRHPIWPELIKTVSEPGSQWQLLGLSDCEGSDKQNQTIRQQRADAVRSALPPAAAVHIVGASGASSYDCITDNTSPTARAWNRAVLITPEQRQLDFVDFEPETTEGKRHVPKPVDQPTVDCSDSQERDLSQAQPLAVDMVHKTLSRLRDRNDKAIQRLLIKYFNDYSAATYEKVHDGFLNTVKGLGSDIKLECESKGSFLYDHFCGSTDTTVDLAYVRSIGGFRVHLCEAAFGRSDLKLAETLVHEFSHMFDNTADHEYCWNGCSASLSTADAIDNADSYAEFAREVYLL